MKKRSITISFSQRHVKRIKGVVFPSANKPVMNNDDNDDVDDNDDDGDDDGDDNDDDDAKVKPIR